MAFSKAQVAILVLCLAVFSTPAAAFSFRNLMAVVSSFGSACLNPTSQDSLPAVPGPFDNDQDPNANTFFCWGYQFTSTHDPTLVAQRIKTDWFKNIGNTLVNPFLLLESPDEEPVFEDAQKGGVLYYPLDGAFGSGLNGTGYGGAPYKTSGVKGPWTYVVTFQTSTALPGITTAKINKALRNLGKRVLRFYPVRGASRRRPGVIDFEITTFWTRQDPLVNGNNPNTRYNLTINGEVTQDRRPKGCLYL